MWTKESFKQPPFSLVNYVDWTAPPSKTACLKDVYTRPSYRRVFRTLRRIQHNHLDDITDILQGGEFSGESPIRILLQGTWFQSE